MYYAFVRECVFKDGSKKFYASCISSDSKVEASKKAKTHTVEGSISMELIDVDSGETSDIYDKACKKAEQLSNK